MKDVNNILKISCECADTLHLDELTEFQGDLKKRDDDDIDKIIKSLKKYGIAFPLFVWKHENKNLLIDGHGRLEALKKLDEYGFLIPPLPVVFIDCKDEHAAKDLLLRLNSSYGTITKESVLEFIGKLEIDTSNFELPCGTIDFNDNTEELPEELKKETKHEISCKIIFDSSDALSNFLERYKPDIQDEYQCTIKVNCEE